MDSTNVRSQAPSQERAALLADTEATLDRFLDEALLCFAFPLRATVKQDILQVFRSAASAGPAVSTGATTSNTTTTTVGDIAAGIGAFHNTIIGNHFHFHYGDTASDSASSTAPASNIVPDIY